jgi:hypothetical protein
MENEIITEQDNIELSPAVALARFLAGTLVDGCSCEECLSRRDTITTLVMGRNAIDMTALAKAVANK